MKKKTINADNWRDYQKSLKRISRRKYYSFRTKRIGLISGGFLLAVIITLYAGSWIFAHFGTETFKTESDGETKAALQPGKLIKADLRELLSHSDLSALSDEGFLYPEWNGEKLIVETGLHMGLQNYIMRLLKRSRTHQAVVVVLMPESGRMLAMAAYNENDPERVAPLFLNADFPAASLFKIISAAGAIEASGFTPDRTMVFRGRKHTLYKSQLRQTKGRYSVKTSFKKAFSGSINPVFGKIGIYNLGWDLISEYAEKFLFNMEIPFDMPISISSIRKPEDDFGLAEIASGFNKKTRISPIHAGLITAAVANKGTIMTPWLVRKVTDKSENVLYKAKPSILGQPISEDTARMMRVLMVDTVKNGTSRKAFSSLQKRRRFREIELGAKTGTINDETDRYKFEWLTIYALPGNDDKGICVAALAVHGEKLGTRASEISRAIVNYYFSS